MTKAEILKLIKRKETQSIEFTVIPSKEIGNSICAFANTNDGFILVGVSDQGGIIGCKSFKKTEEQIANISHSCKPAIYPKIKEVKIDGEIIIVVKVQKTSSIHSYKNISYKRVGTHDKPMSSEEVIEFAKSTGEIQFDSMICEEVTYNDINEKNVKEFLEQRAIKLKVEIPRVSIKDVLIKTIKAVKLVDDKLKLTNAGILFFSKTPQDFIPQSEVKVARFKGTTMTEFIDSAILKGSFYKILRDIEIFFWRNTRLASKIVEFKRVEIPEYPFEAIREAVVNAMAHRDYFRTGATVSILIFDDKIEVQSPGGLLPHLTVRNLEGIHETRNNLICDIFHQTKDMEKYGTGIGKMKRFMEKHGLKQPVLSAERGFFKVTFYSPGDKILDLVPSIPKERQVDLKEAGLNDRQIKILKIMINKNEKITIKKYVNLFNVSGKTAKRDLKSLVESDFVIKKGVKKGAYFEAK